MSTFFSTRIRLTCLGFLLVVLGMPVFSVAVADELVVAAYDDEAISVTRFPAEGEYLMIWLAPEHGFRKAHRCQRVTYNPRVEAISVEAIFY